MKRPEQEADVNRRGFLKLAATAAPAAAVGAVGGAQSAQADDAEPQGNGLRKTAHVKAYLDSARF